MSHINLSHLIVFGTCAVALASCSDGTPSTTNSLAQTCRESALSTPDAPSCTALATDYQDDNSGNIWADCTIDQEIETAGRYLLVENKAAAIDSISTVARVQAYEDIQALIFTPTADPTKEDFEAAEGDQNGGYLTTEGLSSRVTRRYDPHFCVDESVSCRDADASTLAQYPDYCVGPAKLDPRITDTFAAAIASFDSTDDDTPPRVYGARIEAALLWFLYSSVYKESLTCSDTPKDCDSSYAYYTGGAATRSANGLGLSGEIQAVDPEAHDRAWDGIMALRCWRELDSEEIATNTSMREQARDQYDRALLDGMAAIIKDRLEKLRDASDDDEKAYYRAFLIDFTPVIFNEVSLRDATKLTEMQNRLAELTPDDETAENNAIAEAITALDELFACP